MEFVLSLLAGGAGVALVTGIFKLLEVRQHHRISERKDKRKNIEVKIDVNTSSDDLYRFGTEAVLRDSIKRVARSYIAKGEVSLDDYNDLLHMYESYKGSLDALIEEFKGIEVKYAD